MNRIQIVMLAAFGLSICAFAVAGCGSEGGKVEAESSNADAVLSRDSTVEVRARDVESALVTQGGTVAIALPFEKLPVGTTVNNFSKYHTEESTSTTALFGHVPEGTVVTAPITGRAQKTVLRWQNGDGSSGEAFIVNLESDPAAADGTRLVLQMFASTKSDTIANLPDSGDEAGGKWLNVTVGTPLFRIKDSASLTPPSPSVPDHNLEIQVKQWTEGKPEIRGPVVGFLRDKQSHRWILPTQ